MDAVAELRARLGEYPGRGLALYRGADASIRWVYFLSGRSEESRARRFGLLDGSVTVESTSESSGHDPLRHYVCATSVGEGGAVVVGNGEQVQQIASVLAAGGTANDAAELLEPEPDPPIFTPRIAVVVDRVSATTIVVSKGLEGDIHRVVEDASPLHAEAVVVHTYAGTAATPVGSAPGFRLPAVDVGFFTDALWSALDPRFRIMMCEGSAQSAVPVRWWPPEPGERGET